MGREIKFPPPTSTKSHLLGRSFADLDLGLLEFAFEAGDGGLQVADLGLQR
jgi:hypothetical protein